MPSETTKCVSKFTEDNGALEIYKFIKTSWFYKYQIYKYLMKHRHDFQDKVGYISVKKNMACTNSPTILLKGFSK